MEHGAPSGGERGRFVTFEGGDGVGKSTQVRLLAKKLTDLGLKVKITREPGGDEVGEKIRAVLKSSPGLDPLCEVLLLFAARRENFIRRVLPPLEEGRWVVCDRFYDSSLVYQGILKGISGEDIMLLKRLVMGDFEPDLTIVLDMAAETSAKRLSERNSSDEYDGMNIERHQQIRKGFQKIAEIFSFRAALVKADGSEAAVASRIWKILEKRLGSFLISSP